MNEACIIVAEEQNIWKNLAFETCLLEYASQKTENCDITLAILYFWENDNAIVIGKHQNPYKECDINFVEKNNIKIARRITGGGAVYHDIGNINYSFILSKNIYAKEKTFQIIINAFKNLGINVELSERNDILLQGKKFSGNAFYQTKNVSLHHGTILVNSNSEIIEKCLTPNKNNCKLKSVASVKSEIINIRYLYPKITLKQIKEKIIEEFLKTFTKNKKANKIVDINQKRLAELIKKYSSPEWIFGSYFEETEKIDVYQNS